MPTLTVHHLDKSRSHRILWLLEELELTYTIRPYHRHPKTLRAPQELAEVHPLGRSPVVTIDDDVLAESGAIIEELLDRYGEGRLRPAPGSESFRKYRFFLHYAEGSAMPPLLVSLLTSKIRSAPVPFFIKPIARGIADKVDDTYTRPELAKHWAFVEAHLAEHPWFAGDELTGADMQMLYPVFAALGRGGMGGPALKDWMARVQERPAYQRAVERGGPLDIP